MLMHRLTPKGIPWGADVPKGKFSKLDFEQCLPRMPCAMKIRKGWIDTEMYGWMSPAKNKIFCSVDADV